MGASAPRGAQAARVALSGMRRRHLRACARGGSVKLERSLQADSARCRGDCVRLGLTLGRVEGPLPLLALRLESARASGRAFGWKRR